MESQDGCESQQIDFRDDSFRDLMGQLTQIEGYKGSAILTKEGELLYSDFNGKADGRHSKCPVIFDRIFTNTCRQSETSGFLGCDQISIRTTDELIVIRSSAKNCLVGIRLLMMFDYQSIEAMINLKLEKLLPRLMHRLTWDPDNIARLFLHENEAETATSRQRSSLPQES